MFMEKTHLKFVVGPPEPATFLDSEWGTVWSFYRVQTCIVPQLDIRFGVNG